MPLIYVAKHNTGHKTDFFLINMMLPKSVMQTLVKRYASTEIDSEMMRYNLQSRLKRHGEIQ